MTSSVNTAALVDVVVALVSVPLLVVFSLLLESNMRGDWTSDDEARWNVLGLGLALLFVSLLVCCYVIHRLGICMWRAHNRDHGTRRRGLSGSVDSRLQLVVDGELPPTYESVLAVEPPPSYYNTVIQGDVEKCAKSEKIVTVSQTVPY